MSDAFELPNELNIYSAMETRDALLAWVASQTGKGVEHLSISAEKVAEIDGAGLQLLIGLSNMEQPWLLVGASNAFVDACRTMGLGDWLIPLGQGNGLRATVGTGGLAA